MLNRHSAAEFMFLTGCSDCENDSESDMLSVKFQSEAEKEVKLFCLSCFDASFNTPELTCCVNHSTNIPAELKAAQLHQLLLSQETGKPAASWTQPGFMCSQRSTSDRDQTTGSRDPPQRETGPQKPEVRFRERPDHRNQRSVSERDWTETWI